VGGRNGVGQTNYFRDIRDELLLQLSSFSCDAETGL